MYVKFCLRGERNTAVWTRDYFLLGVTSHMIPQLVQAGILAATAGPLALDSVLNSIAARTTLCMYSNVIQVHLVIREHLQAFFPSAHMRGWSFYDVLPIGISTTFLQEITQSTIVILQCLAALI